MSIYTDRRVSGGGGLITRRAIIVVATLLKAVSWSHATARIVDAGTRIQCRPSIRVGCTVQFPEEFTDHVTDISLVARAQQSDPRAFEMLWERHRSAGVLVALGYANRSDAEDLMAEAFTRTYSAIMAGGGPSESFRGYLFSTIRRLAHSSIRRNGRTLPLDDVEPARVIDSAESVAMRRLDDDLVGRAFRSLPTRWQEVLWLSVVEGTSHSEIARRFDLSPNAVSQLAYRAREGLRERWLQEQVKSAPGDSTCRWVTTQAGTTARGNLSKRDSARVHQHLESCRSCSDVITEAQRIAAQFA
jgi:RNA polymerase sigma factor (sigma-70 family)